MKIIALSAWLLLSCAVALANRLPFSQGLTTGSHVPEIKLKNLQNYPKHVVRLSELYKDKPLIIVFWGTTCHTCLKSLPVLDSLHTLLKGAFSVLSVTEDDYADVKNMFRNTGILKNIRLPFITNDKIMSRYFEHRYLPHVVWINRKGIVTAITSEDDITVNNLEDLIVHDSVTLFEKNDDMLFDVDKLYTPVDSLVRFKSLLTGYNPGIRAASYLEADRDRMGNIDSVKRVFLVNTNPVNLFYNAFAHLTTTGSYDAPLYNRVIFKIKDSSLYYDPYDNKLSTGLQWKMNALYCYELATAKLERTGFYTMMFEDLNRYFPVKAGIEKRKMPCYIIAKLNTGAGAGVSNGQTPQLDNFFNEQTGKTEIKIRNLPLSRLAYILNRFSLNMPVMVEESLNKPVDLDISLTIKSHEWNVHYNTEELKTELNRYGLTLVESNTEIPVLVLKDK